MLIIGIAGDVCSLDSLITLHPSWTLEQLPDLCSPPTTRGDHLLNFSPRFRLFFVHYLALFHCEISKTLQLS